MLLELQQLELQRGTKHALHPLNLKLEKGITGLLGPNGAGKSTLMNVLAGITRPTKGTLRLDGREISGRDRAYRSLIGYLPQQAGVIPQLTGREFLLYMAALKGLERTEARNKSAELLEMFHLTAVANQQIRTYSGGMKQRLAIAQSLLNAPRLLLLDEPSVGLDPDERLALKRVLAETAKEAVVLLSTHIVSDVENAAGQLLILKQGRMLACGTPAELIGSLAGKVWELRLPEERAADLQHRYVCGTVLASGGEAAVHVLSPVRPHPEAAAVQATMEDVYLHHIHRERIEGAAVQ